MTVSYTPMIEQYRDIKSQHPNEILFFRLGDFYEMFFEDAEIASKELQITLTSRDAGGGNRVPMCGIPYHAADNYIAKLIRKGFKIAICEQVEDPKAAKGIVKREVIKIITPGTILSDSFLQEQANQYLALLYEEEDQLNLAAADLSTGECSWAFSTGPQRIAGTCDQLFHLQPAEIVIAGKIDNFDIIAEFVVAKIPQTVITNYLADDYGHANDLLVQHFPQQQIPSIHSAKIAVASLLTYLHQTQKTTLAHINYLTHIDSSESLVLDSTTLRNLEISRNMRDNTKKDTLLATLDFTKTAMGSRQLRKWLEYPLINPLLISERYEAVDEFIAAPTLRNKLQDTLKDIYDLERIITKIEVGSVNARDMISLKSSLLSLSAVKQNLQGVSAKLLKNIAISLQTHNDIYNIIHNAVIDEPPFSIREGGIIKDGYDLELDELKTIALDSKKWLHKLECQEKETTGIKNLKISYNKVFGYYIEVTKSNIAAVPDTYIRKQTLVNAERYITPELKEFETKILGAHEKIVSIEYHLFIKVREYIQTKVKDIQQTARQIAQLDVLLSFAAAAVRFNYIKPTLAFDKEIIIKDGRHPVVERLLKSEMFVPNDTLLKPAKEELIILTGPNMAGKSTYMRQVALLVLMAQAGSFIPAREAKISPVDRIFTRVGASDDLATGQSTFMVEMNEVAHILRHATADSLIILDEIGRGTSTYDGISIARAVVEYLISKIKAKTLFATHYHELTDLADLYPQIKNYSVAVKEKGNKVVFLRRIVPGSADKSYGIHVAQLAGLPHTILQRAQEFLRDLEIHNNNTSLPAKSTNIPKQEPQSLFDSAFNDELIKLDIMSMTPIEALNTLFKLQQQAKREAGRL